MSTFWDRKRAELQPQQQPVSRSDGPFWAQGTNLLPSQQTVPQQAVQSDSGVSVETSRDGTVTKIDGHDITQATFLRGKSEECPRCPVSPTTGVRGNLYKPTASSAMRCFDCGWIEDSRFEGQTQGMAAVVEGNTQRAKQVASGGGGKLKIKLNSEERVIGRIG